VTATRPLCLFDDNDTRPARGHADRSDGRPAWAVNPRSDRAANHGHAAFPLVLPHAFTGERPRSRRSKPHCWRMTGPCPAGRGEWKSGRPSTACRRRPIASVPALVAWGRPSANPPRPATGDGPIGLAIVGVAGVRRVPTRGPCERPIRPHRAWPPSRVGAASRPRRRSGVRQGGRPRGTCIGRRPWERRRTPATSSRRVLLKLRIPSRHRRDESGRHRQPP
jgi:hypothetical protein